MGNAGTARAAGLPGAGSDARIEAHDELAQRRAAVAERVLEGGAHFRDRAVATFGNEIRVVAEAAGAGGLERDVPFPDALPNQGTLIVRVAHQRDDAPVARRALFRWHVCERGNQGGVVLLVRGVG